MCAGINENNQEEDEWKAPNSNSIYGGFYRSFNSNFRFEIEYRTTVLSRGIERASTPLVCFGALIYNTIKGLTCLHEIMNRYLIMKCVLKEMAHVLQASVFIPLV